MDFKISQSHTNYYLVVHTNYYTGNIDSFLSGLLFDWNDDRYGYEKGCTERILLEIPFDLSLDLNDHPDSEWSHAYSIPYNDNHDLEFAVDANEEDVLNYINQIWNFVKDKEFNKEDEMFSIEGFSIRKEVSTSLTKK